MARKPLALNDLQVQVLTWIGDGSPEGTFTEGYSHRVVARALERRALIRVSGAGSTWEASITEPGRAFLAGLKERPSAPPELAVSADEVDSLVRAVTAAGGRLSLPPDADEAKYDQLVKASAGSPFRPVARTLRFSPRTKWPQTDPLLYFVTDFAEVIPATEIPKTAASKRLHAQVKEYRDDKEWHYVSPGHVARAVSILQTVLDEGERRGYVVTETGAPSDQISATDKDRGVSGRIFFEVDGDRYGLSIKELPAEGGTKVPVREYGAPRVVPYWVERRGWYLVPSGRLEITLAGPGSSFYGVKYADTKTITLESRLPSLFQSVEIWKVERLERAADKKREEQTRQQQWELAMKRAETSYYEAEKLKALQKQVDAWKRANDIERFVSAARSTPGAGDRQWFDWAESAASKLNPLNSGRALEPKIAAPRPDDLRPYLKGWHPYGPG